MHSLYLLGDLRRMHLQDQELISQTNASSLPPTCIVCSFLRESMVSCRAVNIHRLQWIRLNFCFPVNIAHSSHGATRARTPWRRDYSQLPTTSTEGDEKSTARNASRQDGVKDQARPAIRVLHPPEYPSPHMRTKYDDHSRTNSRLASAEAAHSPEISQSRFQHQELTHADEIRVVQVLAGQRSEPLRCRMLHIRLQDPDRLEYVALSYVWGGRRSARMPMECDGAPIHVTKNCHDALLQLRDETKDREIWVDAVCINQSNLTERNHQVLLMRRIYSNAASVTIFLGHGNPDVASLLRRIEDSDESILPSWTLDETQLIKSFLRHVYWRRMWVLQEIYAGKSIQIMYAGETFQEDLLRKIISIRMAVLDTPLWFSLPLTTLIRESTGYLDLWTLLTFTRTFNASDVRDKVIALLGLVESVPDTVKEILADYASSEAKVMQRVTLHLFLQVIRMNLSDGALSITSWRRLLDSSNLEKPASQRDLPMHSLHIDDMLAASTPPFELLNAVAVSASYTEAEFHVLWRRCHDFLDVALPFNKVITFGGVLRSAVESTSIASSLDAHDDHGDSSEPARIRLAVTTDGALYVVRSASSTNAVPRNRQEGLTFATPLPGPGEDYVDALIDEESRQMGEMMWSSNIVEMH